MTEKWKILFVIAVPVIWLTYVVFFKPTRDPNPKRASMYIEPAGCPNKKYARFQKISCTCADDKYKVDFETMYRYSIPSSRGTQLFRVGNDVIEISQSSSTECNVSYMTDDVYTQK